MFRLGLPGIYPDGHQVPAFPTPLADYNSPDLLDVNRPDGNNLIKSPADDTAHTYEVASSLNQS